MNEFSTVTLIGRPVEDVFAVLTDITRTPMWTPGLSEEPLVVRLTKKQTEAAFDNLRTLLEEGVL
jgi:hypothetical protein